MKTSRFCALIGGAFLPALAFGQAAASDPAASFTGTLAVAGGAASVSGNRGNFGQLLQRQADGFGGIEDLEIDQDLGDDSSLAFTGRAMPGGHDYLFRLIWSKSDTWRIDAGFQTYRVWYDATGGYFQPTATWLPVDGSVLAVDRGHAWIDLTYAPPATIGFDLRYDLFLRQGDVDSTEWGDINVPVYGTRSIVPSVLQLDEHIHLLALKLSQTTDAQRWIVEGRYEHDSLNDAWLADRQPGTALQRDLTTTTGTTTDAFTGSGSYERDFGPRLTFSTGALAQTLDTNLSGSAIYGSTFDAAFSPTYAARQAHDEGYLDLTGGAEMRQYEGNINLDYRPAPAWQTTAAFRFQDTQDSGISDWDATNVATASSPVALTDSSGQSREHWLDSSEEFEALYTGWANGTISLRGDWDQGTGNLVQDGVDLDTGIASSDNDTDYNQHSGKYSAMVNWYARPGLTFSIEGYWRQVADTYAGIVNLTPTGYPQFITDETVATTDLNARFTWRPVPLLSFTTRYDLQRSVIRDAMTGLAAVDSGIATANIVSEAVTTDPLPRLYVTADVSVAYNQLKTPATDASPILLANGDSNYLSGTADAGYALDKLDDLDFDYTGYEAFGNSVDNAATTLPYGAGERVNTASLTWVRKQTQRLIYTVKYTYAVYRDSTVGGLNDYSGSLFYAKVEHKF
ncbi:MAG: hypothetical protein ACREFX_00090 [Opitutaceae bacterium]